VDKHFTHRFIAIPGPFPGLLGQPSVRPRRGRCAPSLRRRRTLATCRGAMGLLGLLDGRNSASCRRRALSAVGVQWESCGFRDEDGEGPMFRVQEQELERDLGLGVGHTSPVWRRRPPGRSCRGRPSRHGFEDIVVGEKPFATAKGATRPRSCSKSSMASCRRSASRAT
jgi:hypothetical protein